MKSRPEWEYQTLHLLVFFLTSCTMAVPAITARYEWILAITTIAFVFSAFGNGANDVANAYASMYSTP